MNTTPIDPTNLRIFPAKNGLPTTIFGGDYIGEGEPDVAIEITAVNDTEIAQFIVDALERHFNKDEVQIAGDAPIANWAKGISEWLTRAGYIDLPFEVDVAGELEEHGIKLVEKMTLLNSFSAEVTSLRQEVDRLRTAWVEARAWHRYDGHTGESSTHWSLLPDDKREIYREMARSDARIVLDKEVSR
jgi:hypothetical protein